MRNKEASHLQSVPYRHVSLGKRDERDAYRNATDHKRDANVTVNVTVNVTEATK